MKRNIALIISIVTILFFALSGTPFAQTKRMVVATGTSGSPWYFLSAAWAVMINSKVPGVDIAVEAGQTLPNVQSIQKKAVDFALTNPEIAYEGYMGTGWAKGIKYDAIRALFPIHASDTVIFCLDSSPIKSIQDLAGKRVSFGPPQTTSDIVARNVFEALGINVNIRGMSYQASTDGLVDGLVDASVLNLAHPAAPILTLQIAKKLRFLQLSNEDLAKISNRYPLYHTRIMPQETYRDFPKGGYKTIEIGTAVIAHKDLPDDLIYTIVKTTFENVDKLKEAMSSATYTTLDRVKELALPLHPGALKYYQEKKAQIPASLIPPK
jgi:uncharacterized protein